MITLSKEQVLMLHERLMEATGGSAGIRDEGMLDSALSNPFQSFGGEELYPSIQAKAAQLCFGLVKNHSMVDGNKRLGTHVMLVFLALNGYELSYSQQELSDTILALASGKIGAEDGPALEQTELAMKHTLFRVSIWDGDCIVAMARMNGDMGLNYYIKDVVVRPEYQGKGIGRMLINELKKFVNDNGVKGTDIFMSCGTIGI